VIHRSESAPLVALALFAAAAVPAVAFYQGHPYRIRYMIPVVTACAVFSGLAVGMISKPIGLSWSALRKAPQRRASLAFAAVLVGALLIESPPWNMKAPMLLEAQWDRGASMGRRAVTTCLARDYHGEKILASMGSLAHYMQELSRSGFVIADFINEGNGVIW